MRLQNFAYLATDGAVGLANAAKSTREAYGLLKSFGHGDK
jgi:hypothetical protein